MIFRRLGLQALLDRLFDDGWCMCLVPEFTGESIDAVVTDGREWA